jgi:thiamine-monophosphate kinase
MSEDPGESFVIERLTPPEASPDWLACGPGDDVAVFQDGTAVTVDAMVEGVHFRTTDDPEDVGAKLVAVNASDLAASGARPQWAVLAISLPHPMDSTWVTGFSDGLLAALKQVGGRLVGGDTTRSPSHKHVSLTLGGPLAGAHLSRSGASAGEEVWVSGVLGDAAVAFALPEVPAAVRRALHRPAPPLDLGPALAEAGLASAAMDLSDGLAVDLARLCAASSCGAVVQPGQLPMSDWMGRNVVEPIPFQVGFGEDYELLFTAPAEHRPAIQELGVALGISLTVIGRTVCGGGARLAGMDWPETWSHFPESA